jgi:hypothetical protein
MDFKADFRKGRMVDSLWGEVIIDFAWDGTHLEQRLDLPLWLFSLYLCPITQKRIHSPWCNKATQQVQ